MTRLVAATVNRRATDVVLSWTVYGDFEATAAPWLLSFDLIGGAEGPIHQFGFRFRDGRVEERFYFDFVAAMNYYVPEVRPERVGDTGKVVFPANDDVARSGNPDGHDATHAECSRRVAGGDVV